MPDNLKTVQSIYEAFGRGDVPAILSALDEHVAWEGWADNTAQKAGVPWARAYRNRDDVVQFFQTIGAWKFNDFRVLALLAGPDRVAAECVVDAVLPNGFHLQEEEVHLWSFDEEGKVTRFRHYLDTAKHIQAAGL